MDVKLIEKAKELGIENAESFTAAQLKIAVKKAEEKLALSNELKKKAESLGIITTDKELVQLTAEIAEAEQKAEYSKLLHEKAEKLNLIHDEISDENLEIIVRYAEQLNIMANEEAREAEVSSMLSEYLGVPDVYQLSKEDIAALLDKKQSQEASGIVVEVQKTVEGKTDESFTIGGKDYLFTDDAPSSFRYLGQLRTQKEWINDPDALELMVAGKLSFLIIKK